MRRAAAVALVFAALVASSADAQEARAVQIPDGDLEKIEKAAPLLSAAEDALVKKDWAAAAASYAKAAETLGDDAVIGGMRDGALYNEACAQARLGHAAKAADLFAQSVKNGLRPALAAGPTGGWAHVTGLRLEHVLVDADLDPIRKEPAYLEALKPYLAAGAPVVEFTRPDTDSLVPAVIVLAAEGVEPARALPAWRAAAKQRGARIALAALAGPVRPRPEDRRWLLDDGDDRWAVAKAAETLDVVAKDPRVDRSRVFVVGIGAAPGEAAWAAATAESKRLAGFAAPGARFHAEWHADAVAALPKTWRVALYASDARPAAMLKERGIEAASVAPSKDESAVAGAILDALLGRR